jgi:hypothetical protein
VSDYVVKQWINSDGTIQAETVSYADGEDVGAQEIVDLFDEQQQQIEQLREEAQISRDLIAEIDHQQQEIERLRRPMVILFGKLRLVGGLDQHDQLPSISRCMELWPELADVTWDKAIYAAKEVDGESI